MYNFFKNINITNYNSINIYIKTLKASQLVNY